MSLGAHTVVFGRRPPKDAYGDPGAGSPTETTVTGCYVQPATSAERTDLRDTVTTGLVAYIPGTPDVVATDYVRWNGAVYAVDGEPDRWDDASGRPHHLEVKLRRVEG